MGGSSAPKPAAPPAPPPPPPPKPMPITDTTAEVDEARREQKKSELRKFGRNKTILAGADLGANAAGAKKTILGG